MKVLLVLQDFHRHNDSPELFTDMVNAFNKNHEAMVHIDLDHAIAFKPDIIFFQGSLTRLGLLELKENTKAKVCMWTGDGTYLPTEGLLMYRDVVDFYLLPFSGESLIPYERLLSKPCYFLWEPIQNWRFIEPKELSQGPISFVGNHYIDLPGDIPRSEIENFIKPRFPEVTIYGNGFQKGPIDYREVPKIYNESYAVICENNYSDRKQYFTPRNIGAMAAGSCPLHKYYPDIEYDFKEYFDCFIYKNKYELVEIISYIKNNHLLRNSIAKNAFNKAKEYYSLNVWVNCFMQTIKEYENRYNTY